MFDYQVFRTTGSEQLLSVAPKYSKASVIRLPVNGLVEKEVTLAYVCVET